MNSGGTTEVSKTKRKSVLASVMGRRPSAKPDATDASGAGGASGAAAGADPAVPSATAPDGTAQIKAFGEERSGQRSFAGPLEKKGHRVKSWNVRFFVLAGDQLRYYAKKGDGVCRAASCLPRPACRAPLVPLHSCCPVHYTVLHCTAHEAALLLRMQLLPFAGLASPACSSHCCHHHYPYRAPRAHAAKPKGTFSVLAVTPIPNRGPGKRANRIDIFGAGSSVMSVAAQSPEDQVPYPSRAPAVSFATRCPALRLAVRARSTHVAASLLSPPAGQGLNNVCASPHSLCSLVQFVLA